MTKFVSGGQEARMRIRQAKMTTGKPGWPTAARRRERGNLMDTKERRKNMKTRANCAFGGCGKVDSKGAMCKHCGFDATQRRIRMAIIKQRGLSRDPATGLCKLVFSGQYK